MPLKAKAVALGGVLAALALVIMLLGGVIPVATYACPMLASFLLLILKQELPVSGCIGWYGIVSLLSVLLCPDKEAAGVFVFLGYYPLLKPVLDRLPRLSRILLKLLLFNLAITAMYALFIWVFRLDSLVEEARTLKLVMLLVFVVLGNGTFLLFDFTLGRLAAALRSRRRR